MNALCFTVEIDDKHFPNIYSFISKLNTSEIIYMSNEYDMPTYSDSGCCYRFEFDNSSVNTISYILADLIKSDYLRKYADVIIDTNYYGIDSNDKKVLVSSIVDYSDTDELAYIIKSFIIENMHIHLGGFTLFRMKEYLSNFEDEIEFAVDEYIEQKRYNDFVKFLKFFVDIQASSFKKINIVIDKKGEYILMDENGIPIDKKYLDSSYCEIAALDDDEYVMLNDIISLAPKFITIHCKKKNENIEPVKMIKEIFAGRVNFCNGCNLCE